MPFLQQLLHCLDNCRYNLRFQPFKDINWTELDEAIPAFFAGIFMGLCYSISYGIAAGFIFYCIVKLVKKETRILTLYCGYNNLIHIKLCSLAFLEDKTLRQLAFLKVFYIGYTKAFFQFCLPAYLSVLLPSGLRGFPCDRTITVPGTVNA